MARRKSLSEVLRGVTVFGRLTVLGEGPPKIAASGFEARCALVRCECGVEKSVRAGDLKHGYATSCGCLQKELAADRIERTRLRHGHSRKGGRSSEYGIWSGMKQRCHSPDYHGYENYGARGITVCDRWRESFEAFLADVGPRPSKGHSLDRIDNDGDYEPGNVRWATAEDQQNNRRANRSLTLHGRTQTVAQWAREMGVDPFVVYARLDAGWDEHRAVFEPVRPKATRAPPLI